MNEERITLRRPRIADLDQLLKIERQCFRTHRFSRRQFRYYIHEKSAIFAIAETGGRLIGYIAGTVHRNRAACSARLYSLAVLSPWRGLGTGGKLLTYFERRVARQKCKFIMLHVRERNRPALALYRKLGYKLEVMLPHYYGPGKSGLKLKKNLKGE